MKIRGFRIEPGEIEADLDRLPEVAEALVLARRDGSGGAATLVAYVVASAGANISWPELRRALGARLPNYLVPTACVVPRLLPDDAEQEGGPGCPAASRSPELDDDRAGRSRRRR